MNDDLMTLPQQNEKFIKREIYIAHDLINKLNYFQNVLKGMFSTDYVNNLKILVGEGSAIELLANKHLAYVEQCLKEKNIN